MAYIPVPTGQKVVTATSSANRLLYYRFAKCQKDIIDHFKISASSSASYHVFQSQTNKQEVRSATSENAKMGLLLKDRKLLENINEKKDYKVITDDPHYTAYEIIGVYDVEDPTIVVPYSGYYNNAPVNDAMFGNTYTDEGINISREEIAKVKPALDDPESEESQEVLSQYDEAIIKMITENDSGEYFIIPTDDGDPLKGIKCTGSNVSKWNNETYMLGQFEDTWLQNQLDDGAMSTISLYVLTKNLEDVF